jgi:hypothetical protein
MPKNMRWLIKVVELNRVIAFTEYERHGVQATEW